MRNGHKSVFRSIAVTSNCCFQIDLTSLEKDNAQQKWKTQQPFPMSSWGPVHTGRVCRYARKSFDVAMWTLPLPIMCSIFCQEHLRAPPRPVWTGPDLVSQIWTNKKAAILWSHNSYSHRKENELVRYISVITTKLSFIVLLSVPYFQNILWSFEQMTFSGHKFQQDLLAAILHVVGNTSQCSTDSHKRFNEEPLQQ